MEPLDRGDELGLTWTRVDVPRAVSDAAWVVAGDPLYSWRLDARDGTPLASVRWEERHEWVVYSHLFGGYLTSRRHRDWAHADEEAAKLAALAHVVKTLQTGPQPPREPAQRRSPTR